MPENNTIDNKFTKVIIAVCAALLAIALFTNLSLTPAANAGTTNGIRAQTILTRTPVPQQYVPLVLNNK